jgi:nitrogen fixation protein NifU and related proteins
VKGYSEALLERFRQPRNVGCFPADTARVARGEAGNRRHGRAIRFELRLDESGKILECRYRVYGCPATIALCSLASEFLPGLTLGQVSEWRGMALAERLQLPAEKRSAVLLLEDAIRAAVRSYNSDTRPLAAAVETGRG